MENQQQAQGLGKWVLVLRPWERVVGMGTVQYDKPLEVHIQVAKLISQ